MSMRIEIHAPDNPVAAATFLEYVADQIADGRLDDYIQSDMQWSAR